MNTMTRISKMVEEKSPISQNNNINNNSKLHNKKLLNHDVFPSKVFQEKNSILVELFKSKHGATVYNLFLTILLSLFINTLIYNYLYNGEIKLGFNLFIKGCFKLHITITIWLGMFAASFLCYYGFKVWALIRIKLPQNSKKVKLWDKFAIGLVIIYYSLFLYCLPLLISRNEIPIASSILLLCDTIRMLMVFHSFIRTTSPRIIRSQKEDKSIVVPSIYSFLYFYFAPTLIYQDVYLRSQKRNWKIIFGYVVELFGVILLMSLLLEVFYLNQLKDYGLRPYSGKEIIMIFINSSMVGLLFYFVSFYSVLNLWFNIFAELLTFSDRTFYQDWWTSSNYETLRRKWNVVVHDWLYTYIYKEFYEQVYSRSKTPAKVLVFTISAVFHEYVLGYSFGFCQLVFSLQFILLGVLFKTLHFKSECIGNVVLLYMLALGNGIVMAIYTMEYYSRVNCPIENFTFYDYFVPHLFRCNK